jgi:eukaryotic-like serine/threonine-protein kinase
MSQEWNWVGRFIAVIVVALILAAAIGSMELFEKTYVIQGKLSASHLVRFLGYSTALGALWMLGQRATIALQKKADRWSFMQHLILPIVTLVVVSFTNSIALLVLKPMMNLSMNNIYNWVFIVAILACAVWVVMAVLGQSSSLTEAFTSVAGRINALSKAKLCAACGTENEAAAKFCKQCGKKLTDTAA